MPKISVWCLKLEVICFKMPKKAQISISIRTLIIEHHKTGKSYRDIADIVQLHKDTVARIVQVYKKRGSISPAKRSGRPLKTTGRIDRAIVKKAELDRGLSATKIAKQIENEFSIRLSSQSVRNRLHKTGLKGRVALKKPWLSAKNIKKRLKWAQDHISWSSDDWNKVIWSDETKVMLFGSDGVTRKWRRTGESLKKECLRPTVKHGGGELLY